VFFFASTAAAGRELWQTAGGVTSLVADIAPGTASSFVSDPTATVNDTIYFAANDGVHGSRLWRSDGTQTVRVGDVYNTTGDSNPQELTDVDGVLYFTANGGHVWRTDGTAAGTQLLFNGAARSLVSFNGKLFFQGNGVLYQSDGTPGGTVPVQSGGDIAQQPYWLTNVNGTLFFATTDNKLWKSDGTSAGTVEVTEFDFGSGFVFPGLLPSSLFNAQGTLFFSADRGDGAELWKSDGTDAGTVQVADLAPGRFEGFYGHTYPNSSAPNSFTESGGTLYFLASNGLNKTDGTAGGTVTIDTPAANDGAFREPFDFEGRLYFFTTDSATHSDLLWATLGTSATTSLIHEFSREDSDPHAANLTNVDGTLFFTDADSGLWKSDGTAAGTRLVRDLSTSDFDAAPHLLTPVGNTLYFIASDSTQGDELWMSDGTSAGTHIVADTIAAGGLGATNPPKNPQIEFVDAGLREIITPATPAPTERMEVIGNDLFFSAVSNEAGRELWRARIFNASPVLTITGTSTYVEKNPVVAIAPTATLTDADSAALQNGLLTATIVDNLSPGDRLRVKNVGTGSGQIGVSGDVVSYGGKQIGTLSGQDETLLSVRLNSSATLAAVQALIRSIGFATSGDAPIASPRSITISISDGDGGIGEATVAVAIQAVNDAPVLGGISGTIGYVHDDPAVVLAALATVTDSDSPDFAGGRLQVRIGSGASSSNRLWLGNGFYADADNNVHFGSIVVGTRVSDGVGLHNLVIVFNENATPSVAQQLLQGIRFKTYAGTPGKRTIGFTLSDGAGGVSDEVSTTVNVS
jgi:ELWxxDGT repeat protein